MPDTQQKSEIIPHQLNTFHHNVYLKKYFWTISILCSIYRRIILSPTPISVHAVDIIITHVSNSA